MSGENRTDFRAIDKKSVNVQDVEKHSSFTVLKKKELFTTVYFLERRAPNDSLAGKYTLYGGGIEPGEVSYEQTITREVGEETGIEALQNHFVSRHFLITAVPGGAKMASEIFCLDPKTYRKRLNTRAIKRFLADARNKQENPRPPRKIRRIGSWWLFNDWSKLSPIAVFALFEDLADEQKRNSMI